MTSRKFYLFQIMTVFLLLSIPLLLSGQENSQIQKSENLAADLATGTLLTQVPNSEKPAQKSTDVNVRPVVNGFAGVGVLFDNGPLINAVCPGTGADESRILAPFNIYGYGFQKGPGFSVADDFVIPQGEEWILDNFLTFGYQSGAGPPSTFTELYVQIWNGKPGQAGSTVIWGNLTTNVLATTSFSGIYRAPSACNTNRPVMKLEANFSNKKLTEGTYWVEWSAAGSSFSGPWIPPVTITGQLVTGNAIQYTGTWNPISNPTGGTNFQGMPFVISGTAVAGPVIITQPDPVIACEFTSTNFTVTATGSGVINYQWWKDGVDIPGATNPSYAIPVLAPTDAGVFTCLLTDENGSTLSNPANLTVLSASAPNLTGTNAVCLDLPIQEYQTDMGQTGYLWRISSGGKIYYDMNKYVIKVEWDTPGDHTVFVSYKNQNDCRTEEIGLDVTVHPSPDPVIAGENYLCLDNTIYNYSTDPGMSQYLWNIVGKGRIVSGQCTANIEVEWTGIGDHQLFVSYMNANGCFPVDQEGYMVYVHGVPASPGTISGPGLICTNGGIYTFSVDPVEFAYSYTWAVPEGSVITSGRGTNSLSVMFPTVLSGAITVFAHNRCGNGSLSDELPVVVSVPPGTTGAIQGPAILCEGNLTGSYQVDPVENALGYAWNLPDGAFVVNEQNTEMVTVEFPEGMISGRVSVRAYNNCGFSAPASSLDIVVNEVPDAPVITDVGPLLTSSANVGNQWYLDGEPVSGANAQTFEAAISGEYFSIVTLNGCSSSKSNKISVIGTGVIQSIIPQLDIFPVPNDGTFTVRLNQLNQEDGQLIMYNSLGQKVFEQDIPSEINRGEHRITIKAIKAGWYLVCLHQGQIMIRKKVLVL